MKLTREEIEAYLAAPDPGPLFQRADRVRREHVGDRVFIRALVEFSNHCVRHCLYCGLRSENEKLERYRMDGGQIVQAVERAVGWGLRTVVLQSGDDLWYSSAAIAEVVAKIRARWPDLAITLSVGERPLSEYELFKRAGANRYLLKHETINPQVYAAVHPHQSFDKRMAIIRHLRALGFQVGVGFIVGLPEQTPGDIAEEILFLQAFQPDMVGIGPFLPQKDTPLGAREPGSRELVLRAVALARIVTEDALMPATTALASLDPVQGLEAGLRAGCNVVMVDATPDPFRCQYRIYDERARLDVEKVGVIARAIGREPTGERGDSFKKGAAGAWS